MSGEDQPLTVDCFFILKAAVGAASCVPDCNCRLTGGASVKVADALACLRSAVGLADLPSCDCGPATTTTTLPAPIGSCATSGVDCHSKFDCEDHCRDECEELVAPCYANAEAEYESCVATCGFEGDVCDRYCILLKHSYENSCNHTHSDCVAPCGDELCDGLHDGPRFEDTGLTVIDYQTRLEWEKKSPGTENLGYSWTRDDTTTKRNGTVFTGFLHDLNNCRREGGCFAGHCDWRLPTVSAEGDAPELESMEKLVTCSAYYGCDDPLLGPVSDEYHWSATPADAWNAWVVSFGGHYPTNREWTKWASLPARAVRDLR